MLYSSGFMAVSPKLDDTIRLKVMAALLKQGSVAPNIREIQKATGFHKATIKSSLEFLKKEGALRGFGPKINIRKFGYALEVLLILHLDTSQKSILDKFLAIAEKDSHVYRVSAILGSGNWNLIARFIYKDVESFHHELQKNYYDAIPGFYNLVKSRQIFYTAEPHYKIASRTDSIIHVILQERGID